jgi:hypothetical protein
MNGGWKTDYPNEYTEREGSRKMGEAALSIKCDTDQGVDMKKIYVLDTNVLLYDPQALSRFEDNSIIIPITVIEEIDRFKKDMNETGRNARAGEGTKSPSRRPVSSMPPARLLPVFSASRTPPASSSPIPPPNPSTSR